MGGCIDGSVNGSVDGWMNEWMGDEWVGEPVEWVTLATRQCGKRNQRV